MGTKIINELNFIVKIRSGERTPFELTVNAMNTDRRIIIIDGVEVKADALEKRIREIIMEEFNG
jgi:hypothetical protein